MVAEQTVSFPHFESQLRELVEDHEKIEDWPLVLAIYYAPQRELQDVFLFEVVLRFGEGEINPEGNFFEVIYGSTLGFPMHPEQYLHLVMANPDEVAVAFREGWKTAQEIRNAFQAGKALILYQTDQAHSLIEAIRG